MKRPRYIFVDCKFLYLQKPLKRHFISRPRSTFAACEAGKQQPPRQEAAAGVPRKLPGPLTSRLTPSQAASPVMQVVKDQHFTPALLQQLHLIINL